MTDLCFTIVEAQGSPGCYDCASRRVCTAIRFLLVQSGTFASVPMANGCCVRCAELYLAVGICSFLLQVLINSCASEPTASSAASRTITHRPQVQETRRFIVSDGVRDHETLRGNAARRGYGSRKRRPRTVRDRPRTVLGWFEVLVKSSALETPLEHSQPVNPGPIKKVNFLLSLVIH